jgi:hypothetical protein
VSAVFGLRGARLVAVSAVTVLVSSLLVMRTTRSAFTDVTRNDGASFSTAALILTEDATAELFSTAVNAGSLAGGASVTRCVVVRYSGSATPVDIRMYSANVSGNGTLAPYLTLLVERGTGGAYGSCSGFVGAATIFGADPTPANNTLLAFASVANWATGVGNWTAVSSPTAVTYQITFTVSMDPATFDLSASVDFVWEAQT